MVAKLTGVDLWWLILCVNLIGSQDTQISGQTFQIKHAQKIKPLIYPLKSALLKSFHISINTATILPIAQSKNFGVILLVFFFCTPNPIHQRIPLVSSSKAIYSPTIFHHFPLLNCAKSSWSCTWDTTVTSYWAPCWYPTLLESILHIWSFWNKIHITNMQGQEIPSVKNLLNHTTPLLLSSQSKSFFIPFQAYHSTSHYLPHWTTEE